MPEQPQPPSALPIAAVIPPPNDPDGFFQHVRNLTNLRDEVRNLSASRAAAFPTPSARRVIQRAQLDAMRVWHGAAMARLEDLRAGRTGPDTNGTNGLIPGERRAEAVDLQRRLIVSLSRNAGRMATLEGAQRRWHAAAKVMRDVIRLRGEVAADGIGSPLRPDARLHLRLSHATFMLEGNSPRLRSELADAVRENPKSKGLAYWLARYELMVGHHGAARDAIQSAGDYPPIRHKLLPLLDSNATNAPWLTWPSNFYTYRYELASDDELRGMQAALSALVNDTEMAPLWVGIGIPQVALDRLLDHAIDGGLALASLLLWNQANRDFERRKYDSTVRNYRDCQRSIVKYFRARYPDLQLPVLAPPDPSGSHLEPLEQLQNALDVLATKLIDYGPGRHEIWTHFRNRYMSIALDELHNVDWRRPNVVPLAYEFSGPLQDFGESTDPAAGWVSFFTQGNILISLQNEGDKVEEKIDAPLLAIALVFCPLAIAEASRLRRHFDEGLSECRQLIRRHAKSKLLSEVVEKPFVKILNAQILLDKADSQYKARALAASPATNPANGSLRYQGLEAAETYQGVLVNFEDQGQYVNRINAAVQTSAAELEALLRHTFHPVAARHPIAPNPDPPLSTNDRKALAQFGKRLTIATLVPRSGDYPEPDRRVGPHEPLVRFQPPAGAPGPGLLESNPLIYALILEARSRLLQMESGLNYLGYSDTYVPPWRFSFLLDRSRYFVEHAKNAQREYLNFLDHAEREEFQEQTAAQNVEMEKSNIRIETARVDQTVLEVESAKAAGELAQLTAANSQARLDAYTDFDAYTDDLQETTLGSFVIGVADAVYDTVPGWGELAQGIGDFFSGGAVSNAKANLVAAAQREMEKANLGLAVSEARQSALIAQSQLGVVQAGLQVAGLQRAAAVLRHEFALQNLTWLRNRTLNSELWYRLSSSIRAVADTYLRYGVEMAFLAEQAYEYEADKRMDVIRFDYDVSDLGNMLAGDFLLRDLDTLEQDLVVTHRLRQQRVRYVLSLAREFPAALQELRDNGAATFTLRLEQLERRFPGLFNLRVVAVEVLPIALLDATRFNLELTHLGSGNVRLRSGGQPNSEPVGTDWLTGLATEWSVRPRITNPETAVYSGLARTDPAESSFFGMSQRAGFEGLPGASTWRVDLSMKENRVVPDSLADFLVTFTLSGYFDPSLRDAVDQAQRRPFAVTSWLSGHQVFPDAYYEFNQSGRMEWRVTPDFLTLGGTVGELRNIGVVGIPAQRRPHLGRLTCSYPVEFEVDATGGMTVLPQLPPVSITSTGLDLDASFDTPAGATITLDPGDGTGLVDPTALPHRYSKPGRYDVRIRIAFQGRLTEYRAAVVVSVQHTVASPVIARPVLTASVEAGGVRIVPTLSSAESLDVSWRVNGSAPDPGTNPASFLLQPGRHVLQFAASRPMVGRFFSQSRFDPVTPVQLNRMHVSSNRTFDSDTGAETTVVLNAFGQHVFQNGTLAPDDTWTLELPLDDNPGLVGVTSADTRRHDFGDLSDMVLSLEYVIHD